MTEDELYTSEKLLKLHFSMCTTHLNKRSNSTLNI